jgi:TDG/mug DNA glycosylase family protein
VKKTVLETDFCQSFPPIAEPDARILILGSMPGAASLAAGQYYAHPRNLFWPIMGRLAGAGPELPYEARVERLKTARIAVWDVLKSCHRQGSLDTAITDEEANDFAGFFAGHTSLTHVFFNGGKAEQSFRRHVTFDAPLELHRLPSTSPAHAGMTFENKLAAWRAALQPILSNI